MRKWKYAFAGYREWRYGGQKTRQLHAARIYAGDARQHLVNQVLDVLRDWRLSPLEHEASCRYGLRRALVMQGHPWPDADREARLLVEEGFRTLGVKRPTWDQGQREYVIPKDYCNQCGCPLDEEQRDRGQRFCSAMCAKSAFVYRDWETTVWDAEIGRAAYRMVARAAQPPRSCAYCGDEFQAPHALSHQRYCSKRCTDLAKEKEPAQECANPRCARTFRRSTTGNKFYCSEACRKRGGYISQHALTCQQCGRDFISSRKDTKFCGARCREASRTDREQLASGRQPRRKDETIVSTCRFCDKQFEARSLRALYCSTNCRTLAQGFRTGTWIPKTISPPVLDYLFRRQGLRITQERMAA